MAQQNRLSEAEGWFCCFQLTSFFPLFRHGNAAQGTWEGTARCLEAKMCFSAKIQHILAGFLLFFGEVILDRAFSAC